MPAGSRCRCALHWGASFLAFPRGGQAPSGVGVTLGTRPGLLQTGTLVRASALSLPNGTWLAGRVRSAGQAPGRRPCMGRPDDQPTSGTHGPPARPGSAHAARPPECQLLCSRPEQSQSAKRSPRGGERGSEGGAGYVPGKAGLVCPRGGKGVCCMASWWSLVNCWGRRDTRAKKVIVIEYKSHHITKAVTELRTGREGHAHTWRTRQNSRTWPGRADGPAPAGPLSPSSLGSPAARPEPARGPTAQAWADERPLARFAGWGRLTATGRDWLGLRASAASSRGAQVRLWGARGQVRLWGARGMVAPANPAPPGPVLGPITARSALPHVPACDVQACSR